MRLFFLLFLGAGGAVPCPASDFAVSVQSYVQGGSVPSDFLNFELFTNSAAALGAPTVDTTSDDDPIFGGGKIALGETVPVVPVFPAFRSFEMVSIGTGGLLSVMFDHPVLDDPANPYGMDFIVFGNVQFDASLSWSNRNPDEITVSDALFPQEMGEISVSQDGTNWFAITNAPFADHAFAPTLGRVYDPDNVDTNLGGWNAWWGGPTDPTFPVDPAVVLTNLDGWTVTKLARHYGSSAGGTPYDIHSLPLSPTNGMKWIQYVKVENNGSFTPEIDAFSDVAPGEPYTLWQLEQFDWLLDPTNGVDHADPDGDGLVNLFEYALNRAPLVAESEPPIEMVGVSTSAPAQVLVSYERNTQAVEVVVSVQQTGVLPGLWTTNDVMQVFRVVPGTNGSDRITAGVPADLGACFINLNVERP